jgi:cytoskeletal protein CcmA (bactofilin family)
MLRGRVEGSINHTATLRIGKEGTVVGNITAKFITVEGRVEGDLHGNGAVTVKESANIDGNIFSPTVSLLEGANFNGSIEMRKKKAEAGATPRSADMEPRPASRVASGNK